MSKTNQPKDQTTHSELEKDSDADRSSEKLTIVGIGASAGGLAALKTFFAHVPEDSGLAFVVVVHLDPDHESHLADLLQPHVNMPIQQVQETIPLQPNQVYVIPPGCNLNSIDTHLRLSDLEARRRDRAPIDHFFRTLSETHDGHSVGVILTGTGADGTLGMKEIKGRGGLTIVQDPSEAEYDGMPQSALSTGMVDLVLPLADICGQILRFEHTRPDLVVPPDGEEPSGDFQRLLQKIFAQVHTRTGRDFSRYKRSTILRRIQRRMQLHQHVELEDYLTLLRTHPEEVQALSDELLITVTNFFRDPQVFEHLEKEVIPALFTDKTSDDSVRVWSVGCATGEEAYSLAILLLEEANQSQQSRSGETWSGGSLYNAGPDIQVFASDLHEHSIRKAREGYYPGDIETDVSAKRLKQFFVKEDGGYRIRKEVRDCVVFAPHNLLADPPFSRIDLIVCRNMLIYLQRPVQREVIELFHYALQPQGYLLLGTSETIESTELFRAEHKGNCLFQKRNVPVPELHLPVFPQASKKIAGQPAAESKQPDLGFGALHQQTVERFAPPSLLVSPDDKVVHLSERVGRYLVLSGGEATYYVYKLVRQELQLELRQALRLAQKQGEATKTKPIPLTLEGQPRLVILSVFPAEKSLGEGFSVVVFDEREPLDTTNLADSPLSSGEGADHSTNQELQAELERTQQQLQALIGEYETGQEEMKASNEEMQSANEELRSTMEELETSKEELQSMNEELATLNQENRHKVAELTQLSGDLQNLLKATDIATLFLDRQLRILRFTPRVSELFNVRLADRGRPLSDITHRLGEHQLLRDARQVLDQLTPVEREVQDQQQRWFLTRVLPYRSIDERIEGVVLTFIDITERKQAEQEREQAKQYAEQIVASMPEPLLVLTPDLQVQTANQTFYDKFQVDQASTVSKRIYDLGNRQWDISPLRKLLEEVLPEDERFYDYEMQHDFEQIGLRTMLMSGRRLEDLQLILVSIKDITERVQMEEALRLAKEEAERAAQAKEDFLAHMSHEIRTPLNAVVGLADLLLQHDPQEEQLENLQTLKFSAHSLRMLVNDILDFSKIQAGKVMVEETEVLLSEVLHSIQKAHQLQAHEQDTELNIVLDEQLPAVVRTDSLKLSQVLNNLVSNAVKFTQAGVVTVDVSLVRKREAQFWLRFSVQDTGIGISQDQQASIFDAFTQADISTARQYGGTGLGLSITKLLLELMGSHIEVESEEGKGAYFFFTLRVSEGAFQKETLEEGSAAQEETLRQAVNMKSLQVLLVEDAAINRMVLNQFLQDWWDLVPDEAVDGQQAVELAQQKEYDLILMDVRMPLMDGYQAAQAIRQLPGYKKVPILALTADTVHEVKKHPEAALFADVITKPFDSQDLRQKMIRYASKRVRKPSSAGRDKNQPKGSSRKPAPGIPMAGTPVAGIPVAGRLSKGKSAASTGEFTLRKLKELLGDERQTISEFLKQALKSFTEFESSFAGAMAERDTTALGDLSHKMIVLFDTLELHNLMQLVEHCHRLLQEQKDSDQIEEARQKVEAMVIQVTHFLKQSQENLQDR
uniref:Chemotaxis protein CheB n=1 Tax=Roseihalotalea indica TaxID=2867963 RepID=A0AA49GJW0_9BACT|nr:chemotaxis protein CheB [Tunicatimonas sp. TK19036]